MVIVTKPWFICGYHCNSFLTNRKTLRKYKSSTYYISTSVEKLPLVHETLINCYNLMWQGILAQKLKTK